MPETLKEYKQRLGMYLGLTIVFLVAIFGTTQKVVAGYVSENKRQIEMVEEKIVTLEDKFFEAQQINSAAIIGITQDIKYTREALYRMEHKLDKFIEKEYTISREIEK